MADEEMDHQHQPVEEQPEDNQEEGKPVPTVAATGRGDGQENPEEGDEN